MNTAQVNRSYSLCEAISRKQAGNFYPAFRVLPAHQRRAMCALYAFLRIADDVADEPGDIATKRSALRQWRTGLEESFHAQYTHPIYPALHHTVQQFAIPKEYLTAALDGVEMDLTAQTYTTFADLRRYCFHVASVVGLSCIHIWGFANERAKEFAEQAGIAFQLTNILRDLGEDAGRGRIYLPADELAQFDYDDARLTSGQCDEQFRALMRFQIDRARQYYETSWQLVPMLSPAGRAVFLVMARTYRSLLDVIERQNYDVFTQRARVSCWRKMFFAVRALPVRYGMWRS